MRVGLLSTLACIIATCILAIFLRSHSPRFRYEPLRLMSFNIRSDFSWDKGRTSWANRREAVMHVFTSMRPTIVGMQEGYFRQMVDIEKTTGYQWVGDDRDTLTHFGSEADEHEYNAVFYDPKVVARLRSETFKISSEEEGKNNRICTAVRFVHVESDVEFWVYNTHLENDNNQEAIRQAVGLIKRIRSVHARDGLPFFVFGDFNCNWSPIVLEKFAGSGMFDTYAHVHGKECAQPHDYCKTFHNFGEAPKGQYKIDYVLASHVDHTIDAYIANNTVAAGAVEPSDHYPVVAVVAHA